MLVELDLSLCRDVAPARAPGAPAPHCTRRTAGSRPRPAALPEAAPPRQRIFPRRARTPWTTGVRATACRARTRAHPVLPALPPGPCPWSAFPPLVVLPLRRREGAKHYKRGTAGHPHAPVFPLPNRSVGAIRGGCGEPQAPTAYPSETSSTSSCTYDSSPTRSLFQPSRHLAGTELLKAAATWPRRALPPAAPRHQLQPKTEPKRLSVHPPTASGRPRRRGSSESRRPRRPTSPRATLWNPFCFQGGLCKVRNLLQ
jgi:hypothetical protein